MCPEEVLAYVDSVVTKEAETIWPRVLQDVQDGRLQRQYDGGHIPVSAFVPARQDLLPAAMLWTIQTTRGCP